MRDALYHKRNGYASTINDGSQARRGARAREDARNDASCLQEVALSPPSRATSASSKKRRTSSPRAQQVGQGRSEPALSILAATARNNSRAMRLVSPTTSMYAFCYSPRPEPAPTAPAHTRASRWAVKTPPATPASKQRTIPSPAYRPARD